MPRRSRFLVLLAATIIVAWSSPIRAQQLFPTVKLITPLEPAPKDSELRKLQKQRFNAGAGELKAAVLIYEEGLGQGFQALEEVFQALARLTEAEIDLHPDPNDRIKVYERQLALAKELGQVVKDRSGKGGSADSALAVQRAVAHQANVEILLIRARRTLEKSLAAKTTSAKSPTTKSPTTKSTAKKATPTKSDSEKSSSPKPKTTSGEK
jgi:hypothetical protein